jgi:hypothetical protein
MKDGDSARLARAIRDELGESLRVVATGDFEGESLEILFLRDDLADVYTMDVAEERMDEMLSEWHLDIGDTLTPEETGSLQATVRFFEEITYVTVWDSETPLYVEFEPGMERLATVFDLVERELGGRVAR